jgi:hypothetical protein
MSMMIYFAFSKIESNPKKMISIKINTKPMIESPFIMPKRFRDKKVYKQEKVWTEGIFWNTLKIENSPPLQQTQTLCFLCVSQLNTS